jgi:YHS domain-containing protein
MSAMDVGISVFLIAAAAAPVGAICLGQQPAGPPTTAAAEVTTCVQAQLVVDRLLAMAMARLEAARQTNAAADLRAAVDSVEATVRDARAQLAPCASTQPTTGSPGGHMMPMTPATPAAKPSDPPMDHSKMPMGTAPAAKPGPGGKSAAPAAPTDHSRMPMSTPPDASAQAVDPVCGLRVDPATASRATHRGKTYSFCSEQHRELFQKNPAKYLSKGQ